MTPESPPMTVGVRERRKSLGLTQAQLAEAIGVSRQTIISIERSDYAPSVYLALRLAVRLNSTVEQLFPLEGESR
ncbi:helix-turn-helix transcriptional regulator [Nesterenkonia massiliensis]|uniref:helix-turn-helix transcriptional regulator n=1 Tax=Nesterenkonia massiliensis TaxID=1232429 RepID=UPI000413BB08